MKPPDEALVTAAEIGEVFRSEHGRAVASLIRYFGDIDIAEDAAQEAFETALRKWPDTGVPPSPAGWIITTARNRGIDRIRRESSRSERQREAATVGFLGRGGNPAEVVPDMMDDDSWAPGAGEDGLEDDRLRLVFTCCHPALAPHAQVALTLRLVAGLQTSEIARAFLVPEPTMAQRLVRAKGKIKSANIPYRVPPAHELPDRLGKVLAVVYLIFNEGYLASSGDTLHRQDLTEEAVRLGRLLVLLMPDEPEALGLLGLMLLTEARHTARSDSEGGFTRLADQDRQRWDRDLIDEGHAIVRACLRRARPGPYQLQAAIAAVHTDASTAGATDWSQIVALYDQLLRMLPTPVVALNRAIAVGEVSGPTEALALVDDLHLDDYHLYHSSRAELLLKLDRNAEAVLAFDRAIALTNNETEGRHLAVRRLTAEA